MTDQKPAMMALCGLPSKYEISVVANDAVADDEKLMLESFKSRLIPNKQRIIECSKSPNKQPHPALTGRTENRNFAGQISA